MKKYLMFIFLVLFCNTLSARYIFDGKIIFSKHGAAKDSVYFLIVEKAGGVLDTVAGFDTLGNVTLYGDIFSDGSFWINAGDTLFWIDATLADTMWAYNDGNYLKIGGNIYIYLSKTTYFGGNIEGTTEGWFMWDGWGLRLDSDNDNALAYISFHAEDSIIVDTSLHVMEWTGIGGIHADVMVCVTSDTIASAATLVLTNHNNFVITGTANIDSIDQSCAFPDWAIAYIEFTDIAAANGMVDGKNLKLEGNFVHNADDMIMLQRRGNIFYEISRSPN